MWPFSETNAAAMRTLKTCMETGNQSSTRREQRPHVLRPKPFAKRHRACGGLMTRMLGFFAGVCAIAVPPPKAIGNASAVVIRMFLNMTLPNKSLKLCSVAQAS
jgi:hypothetical protein